MDHDAARDHYMRKRGLRVLRLGARDVMADPDAAAHAICDYAVACIEKASPAPTVGGRDAPTIRP